eukprot:3751125-Alexandrium_andersonii.AAC.1
MPLHQRSVLAGRTPARLPLQGMLPAPVTIVRAYRASGGTISGPSAHFNSLQGSERPDGLPGCSQFGRY